MKTVLAFFTGAEDIPPLGFETTPGLRFCNSIVFPTASTCALELTLPTKYHDNEEVFREKIIYGMLNHGGFGLS